MTDDEEDSAVKPIPEKKPFKISSHFFFSSSSFFFFSSCPLHETNFCSGIKLSVASVAPQTHSRAPKIWGRGREMGEAAQTVGECVKVSPRCCSHYASPGMETWTFYKKSVIIFTALLNWYFSHMSLRFILLLQVSQKSSVLCSAGRGAAACHSLPLSEKNNNNEAPIYHSSCLLSSLSSLCLPPPHSLGNFLSSVRLIFAALISWKRWLMDWGSLSAGHHLWQETENSHQLEAMCSHACITKGLFKGRTRSQNRAVLCLTLKE